MADPQNETYTQAGIEPLYYANPQAKLLIIGQAPGKKAQIKVTFDPAGRPGPFTKTISVYSNGKTGSFIMNIRGEVE